MRTSFHKLRWLSKMATADPLDDLLNAVVDGQEISALVGTLESQLASPTNQESPNQNSTTSINSNHVGDGRVGDKSTLHTGEGSLTGQKPGSIALNVNHSTLVGHNGNVVSSFKLNTNAAVKSRSESPQHANNIQKQVIVSIGSTNTGTITVNSSQNNVGQAVTNQLTATPGSTPSGSAIYNLASVAAEAQPLSVPQNSQIRPQLTVQQPRTVREQLEQQKDKTGNVTLNKPQFVVKSEPNKVQVRTVTNAQGQIVTVQSAVPQAQNVNLVSSATRTTAGTPPSVNSMTNPVTGVNNGQNVPVVRPPSSNIQVISVNPGQPRMAGGTPQQRTIAPRVITSAPIRIAAAPNQQMVAPRAAGPTITLPPGLQLPPGTMLMKNEQGQLVFVSQQGAPVQPQATSQGQPATIKLQTVRPPGQVVSAPQGIVTISSPQTSHITVRPQSSTAIMRPTMQGQPQVVTSMQPRLGQPPVTVTSQPQVGAHGAQVTNNHSNLMENVKKCKNFLSTLIKLASNQPADTVKNVKNLIQGLIDGRIEPEQFTAQLQVELKSSPQPYLVPFLKRSLPLLRQSLHQQEMSIEGVKPPPPNALSLQPGQTLGPPMITSQPRLAGVTTIRTPQPGMKHLPQVRHLTPQQMMLYQQQQARLQGQLKLQPGQVAKTVMTRPGLPGQVIIQGSQARPVVSVQPKEKRKYDSLNDDADINDVATMGGVNLSEESRNILATNSELMLGHMRSCKDENFLIQSPLQKRINEIAHRHGLEDVPPEVANLISHATQERLRTVAEKLSLIAEHRLEIYKGDSLFETTKDVRSQLKFLEELDKLEKKRHEEAEREVLLRAAKSRSKHEDPEQLKLKEKAKALQQQEMEELRHQEANRTALMAIGSRKKKKLDDSQHGNGSSSTPNGSSSNSRTSVLRQRIKRVTLRDIVFLLEQEKETKRSPMLYRAFLK